MPELIGVFQHRVFGNFDTDAVMIDLIAIQLCQQAAALARSGAWKRLGETFSVT